MCPVPSCTWSHFGGSTGLVGAVRVCLGFECWPHPLWQTRRALVLGHQQLNAPKRNASTTPCFTSPRGSFRSATCATRGFTEELRALPFRHTPREVRPFRVYGQHTRSRVHWQKKKTKVTRETRTRTQASQRKSKCSFSVMHSQHRVTYSVSEEVVHATSNASTMLPCFRGVIFRVQTNTLHIQRHRYQ